MIRYAKPDEFTFKRDSFGHETVEHEGCIVARLDGPDGSISLVDPAYAELPISLAISRAAFSGFWRLGTPGYRQSPVSVTVTAK